MTFHYLPSTVHLSISRGALSPKNSEKTPHRSPVRALGVNQCVNAAKLTIIGYSTTICKLVDLILALHQSDCRIPNWVSAKTVLSSSTNCTVRKLHTSGFDASHVQ